MENQNLYSEDDLSSEHQRHFMRHNSTISCQFGFSIHKIIFFPSGNYLQKPVHFSTLRIIRIEFHWWGFVCRLQNTLNVSDKCGKLLLHSEIMLSVFSEENKKCFNMYNPYLNHCIKTAGHANEYDQFRWERAKKKSSKNWCHQFDALQNLM